MDNSEPSARMSVFNSLQQTSDNDSSFIPGFDSPRDMTSFMPRENTTEYVSQDEDIQVSKGSKKMKWTPEEDEALAHSVEIHGTGNWSLIASELVGRNGKQCRERWTNQLNPELTNETWGPHEDAIILQQQMIYGNAWAKIARFLPGRSGNAVKNRFTWLTKQRMRLPRFSNMMPFMAQRAQSPFIGVQSSLYSNFDHRKQYTGSANTVGEWIGAKSDPITQNSFGTYDGRRTEDIHTVQIEEENVLSFTDIAFDPDLTDNFSFWDN